MNKIKLNLANLALLTIGSLIIKSVLEEENMFIFYFMFIPAILFQSIAVLDSIFKKRNS